MTATWLSFCTKRPGPPWKQGYFGIPSRPLTIIEGEVKHITLGPMSAALGVLDGPGQVSWPFTIPKVGEPLQHYPLESVNWHAGLMGYADLDTELVGNISLVGEEHEGVDGDTPTDSQFHWSVEISKEMRRLCPLVAANPPELAVNLWEHNWLVATSCPNRLWSRSRNNWDWLITALAEEGDMDEAEVRRIVDDQVKRTLFRARPTGGAATGAPGHPLETWLGSDNLPGLLKHVRDDAKHASGGISKEEALAIAKAEDDKLKVRK